MAKKSKNMNNLNTILGKDSEFTGDMKFFGTIQIDGKFDGSISGEGTLMVGKAGKLRSDVNVLHVQNHGEIVGNIIAAEKIEVFASGKIYGEIETPVIAVEKGAMIKGNCTTNHIDGTDQEEKAIIKSKKPKKIE